MLMVCLCFKVDQADILPTEMVFTIKDLPRLGHVVKLTNSSDGTASPVLDYIHTFTQDDIDRGHILYVSASIQVYCHVIYTVVEQIIFPRVRVSQ